MMTTIIFITVPCLNHIWTEKIDILKIISLNNMDVDILSIH